MDIQLPDIDGTTLVRILREMPATRKTTILALTAYAMKGDRERILQAECDGYISKPIDVQAFINTVSSFLNTGAK
jgi:CheY-like chemotaxis protein